jgi:hypothetical protein
MKASLSQLNFDPARTVKMEPEVNQSLEGKANGWKAEKPFRLSPCPKGDHIGEAG